MFYFLCLWTSFDTQKWQWAALMFQILYVDTNKWHQEMSLRHCGHVNLSCITIQRASITDALQHDCWRISTFWLNCNLTLLFTHFHSRWVSSTARLNGKCRFYCPFTDRLKNELPRNTIARVLILKWLHTQAKPAEEVYFSAQIKHVGACQFHLWCLHADRWRVWWHCWAEVWIKWSNAMVLKAM